MNFSPGLDSFSGGWKCQTVPLQQKPSSSLNVCFIRLVFFVFFFALDSAAWLLFDGSGLGAPVDPSAHADVHLLVPVIPRQDPGDGQRAGPVLLKRW